MKILIVDDEVRLGELVADALGDEDHDVSTARSGEDAIALVDGRSFDLVITDLRMPPPDGLAVLSHCRSLADPPEVVMMTAHGSVANAVAAMRAGAHDYLTKPFELEEVVAIADRVADLRRVRTEREALRAENERLRAKIGDEGEAFAGIIGDSEPMREVFTLARKVSDSDATVLIRGESGTGKGRLARAIHAASPRRDHPFVKINCGALPETLLESELFGHEKGSFTGAIKQKPGRFETAEGGTVFLDEIGEISPAVQVKLLQVLEEKTFVRVGGTVPIIGDVRILAATHRDLESMIREKEFREDLFYRLNVFPLEMPPLRVRGNDLVLLVEHILAAKGVRRDAITGEAMQKLLGHPFPGNVRELENVLERAIILAGDEPIDAGKFPALIDAGSGGMDAGAAIDLDVPATGLSLEAVEKTLIQRAMERAGGNKSHAARLLGVTRRTLYSRMEKHGLALGAEEEDA
jgi:two-component system NtrC family response regulator